MARQARGNTSIAPRRAAGKHPAPSPGDGPGRRHSRPRSQGGFGLLEAVVSLALVSTVVLTLAGGLLTSVKSSTSAKGTQQVDAALSAYAESFKGVAFDPGWAACPSAGTEVGGVWEEGDFEGAGTAPAWFTAADTDVVDHRVTATEGWDGSEWQACGSWSGAEPPGSVRLTISVTVQAADGLKTSTGQVVVRRVA